MTGRVDFIEPTINSQNHIIFVVSMADKVFNEVKMKKPCIVFIVGCILICFFTARCKKNVISEVIPVGLKVDSVYLWLSQMQQPNGLLLSSGGGKYVSLYDNALAAITFSAYGDYQKAERIFDFFNSRLDPEFRKSPGGFGQMRTADGIPVDNRPHRWLGDNAWLLIAINNYHFLAKNDNYKNLANELSQWILSLQDLDGGLWGGFDANGTRISKITEGNLDAFNAIPGFTDFHKRLLVYFKEVRWDTTDKLLIAWGGYPKYRYALDLHSWGYCVFDDFPTDVLSKAGRYAATQKSTVSNQFISGYCFDEDRDVVWLEGTGQMVVAFIKASREAEAQKYLQEMKKNLVKSSSFSGTYALPYAVNWGSSYGSDPLWSGADTNPAVSSTAWYLFGMLRFDPLELGYTKQIPSGYKFWVK